MGNQPQHANSSWVLERYAFLDEVQATPFGRISLFRKKQENYDYLMVMSRKVHPEYLPTLNHQLQFLTRHRNTTPFLKVYNVFTTHKYLDFGSHHKQNRPLQSNIKQTDQSCFGKAETWSVVNICVEYLTYTLLDHITFKKRLRQQIWMAEYAYILKQCIAAAQLFDSWQLSYLTFDLFSHHLFITPSGQLKALPFRSAFLQDDIPGCECFGKGCIGSKQQSIERQEMHTYSYIALNKKQSKFVKQIKNLSLELVSTLNLNLDPHLRKITPPQSTSLLSLQELAEFTKLQSRVNKIDSLQQLSSILQQVEDDFILIGSQHNSQTNKVIVKQPQLSLSQHLREQTGSLTDWREPGPTNNTLGHLQTNGEVSHYSSVTHFSRPSVLQQSIHEARLLQITPRRY